MKDLWMMSTSHLKMPKRIPPKWYTIPDFIEISDYDVYHLFEGYCITVVDEKKSGKFYKKVLLDGDYHQFLSWMGYSDWWEHWCIERNPIKRMLSGNWKRRVK